MSDATQHLRAVKLPSTREWISCVAAVLAVAAVLTWVDLRPRVQEDFFFSAEDPALQTLREIDRRFPPTPQIIVRATGTDIDAENYRTAVGALGEELARVAGITGVYSVATESATSPLWSRLLLPPGGSASNLILQVEGEDPEALVDALDGVLAEAESSSFELEMSGVPIIIERIRRNLFRDLVVFSLAAILVFGLLVGFIYRRVRIVIGTLVTCLGACGVTLVAAQAIGLGIGLLTANLVTIVFVLTLSHIVFITANFGRATVGERGSPGRACGGSEDANGESLAGERSSTPAGSPVGEETPARAAVRLTVGPSFWCMVTTLLGFSSLLLATALPLRELGMAGGLGTVVAFGSAYLLYPPFLASVPPWGAASRGTERQRAALGLFPKRHGTRWLGAIAAFVILVGAGLWRLDTDPGLLTYFEEGSELRRGLEAIDDDGGSSTLKVIVRDNDGRGLGTREVYAELWAFQEALEEDPSVGVVVSPAVLLEHARSQPLAGFLPLSLLLEILDSALANEIGRSFVAPDRTEALYLLRMREGGRSTPRAEVIERVRGHAERSGLEPVLVGGQYELQAQLGRLIAASLRLGLGGLVLLFVGVATVVSRSFRTTLAMVACLAAIPLVVLGTFGHLGVAVDIITSPGANVALAMGVDSMIHVVSRVRLLRGDLSGAELWWRAREELARPVLAASVMICLGFGIFGLSTFPPTQRFGLAVILGTATAATMALVALPFAAQLRIRER